MEKFLIVGLGNPGKEYQNNRHNVGFLMLDNYLLAKNKEIENNSNFKNKKNIKGELAQIKDKNQLVILLKPTTFMNNSGKAVLKTLQFFNIPQNHLVLIHDELDLDLGKIRFSWAIGAAGHRGVISVIQTLKSKEFFRLRVGIDSPSNNKKTKQPFVLSNFTKNEKTILKQVKIKVVQTINIFLKEGYQKATNFSNQK